MSAVKKLANILGVKINLIDWNDFYEFIESALNGNEARQIVTINGEIILKSEQNPEHQAAINSADLVTIDTTNIQLACFLKGFGWPPRLPGADIVGALSAYAAKNNYSIYLLGGRKGVAEKSAQNLKMRYLSLNIAGFSEDDPDEMSTAETIKKSGAKIVFVAYGAPNQELWINKHKDQTGARILIGIGGVFDMLSGNLPRAPKIFRTLHFEWLWRLNLEPKRLGRIFQAIIVFPLKVLFS